MARFTNSPQSVKSYERLFEISNFDNSKYNDPFLEIAKLLIQNTSFYNVNIFIKRLESIKIKIDNFGKNIVLYINTYQKKIIYEFICDICNEVEKLYGLISEFNFYREINKELNINEINSKIEEKFCNVSIITENYMKIPEDIFINKNLYTDFEYEWYIRLLNIHQFYQSHKTTYEKDKIKSKIINKNQNSCFCGICSCITKMFF